MPSLPRFNSGAFGELQWHHLNDVFDFVDASRVPLENGKPARFAPFLLATLTQENTDGRFAWSETQRKDDGTFAPMDGGFSSTVEGDSYAYPAISFGGSAEVGDTVVMVPRRTVEGNLYYAIMSSAGSQTRAFKIVGAIQHATRQDMWTYNAVLADFDFQTGYGGVWNNLGAAQYQLQNGAENPSDAATSSIGVGTIPPGNVTSVRRPIKNGTVVTATKIGNGTWTFSMPNGYSFTCTP